MKLSLRPPRRLGFTLVELLVVIAIIGTLVALLLPAVQSAREAARSNTCRNNLKQLVLAMTNYDASQSKLPGYVNELPNQGSPRDAAGNFQVGRRASWLVMMFPYIEQDPLWDRWTQEFPDNTPGATAGDVNGQIDLPEIVNYQCPSDAPDGPGTPASSYVANAGEAFGDEARGDPSAPTQPALNVEYAPNGVFFDLNRKRSGFPTTGWSNVLDGREQNPELQMSIDYVQGGDGTSKTMMISENINAVAYTYGFDTASKEISDAKHHFGFVWASLPDRTSYGSGIVYENKIQTVNGGLASEVVQPTNFDEYHEPLGYPSANHPGGVNMGFCDGRVQFLSENIDPRIYAQSMTTKYKRSKYFDQSVTPANKSADRFLPQPTDADL